MRRPIRDMSASGSTSIAVPNASQSAVVAFMVVVDGRSSGATGRSSEGTVGDFAEQMDAVEFVAVAGQVDGQAIDSGVDE